MFVPALSHVRLECSFHRCITVLFLKVPCNDVGSLDKPGANIRLFSLEANPGEFLFESFSFSFRRLGMNVFLLPVGGKDCGLSCLSGDGCAEVCGYFFVKYIGAPIFVSKKRKG